MKYWNLLTLNLVTGLWLLLGGKLFAIAFLNSLVCLSNCLITQNGARLNLFAVRDNYECSYECRYS